MWWQAGEGAFLGRIAELGRWSHAQPLELAPARPPFTHEVRSVERGIDSAVDTGTLVLAQFTDDVALCLGERGLSWARHPDQRIRVVQYVPAKGGGGLELLLSSAALTCENLLLRTEPYTEAAAAWFDEVGDRLGRELGLPVTHHGCADA